MKTLLFAAALACGTLAIGSLDGQSPAPIVMQAATPVPAVVAASIARPVAQPAAAADSPNLMQLLQTMQATNADTIHKQEAALETLDGLQKAAEQIKIFSKRS